MKIAYAHKKFINANVLRYTIKQYKLILKSWSQAVVHNEWNLLDGSWFGAIYAGKFPSRCEGFSDFVQTLL